MATDKITRARTVATEQDDEGQTTQPPSRAEALANAIMSHVHNPDDASTLVSPPDEVSADGAWPIELIHSKNWDNTPEDELPLLPEAYFWEWVRDDDGKDYHLKAVTSSSHPAIVMDDSFRDGLYVDESVKRGKFASMDFYWGAVSGDQAIAANQAGYVDVKSSDYEDITNSYIREGGKVLNGDLKLMMRPKQVSNVMRYREQQKAAKLLGQRLETNTQELDNLANHDYGRVESAELRVSKGGSEDIETRKQVQIAEQLANARQNAQRGKVTFGGMNAPFQKTIVGGRTLSGSV